MKTTTSALAAHYLQTCTTLATCWRVRRMDGEVFGFCTHTRDLVIDGLRYAARSSFEPSALEGAADLSVANMEVQGVLDSSAITERDMLLGRWSYAWVEVFEVNYLAPSAGRAVLRVGTLGQVTISRGTFTAELRGLAQPLQQAWGEVYSLTCRADYGDSRCKIDIEAQKVAVTIAAVDAASPRRVFYVSASGQAAGWATNGKVLFTSGDADGFWREVATHGSAERIELAEPLQLSPAIGDALWLYPGCDKTLDACKAKGNVINMRAEPYLPGPDVAMSYGSGEE